MTLQINKDNFIHDGVQYPFSAVGYLLYQPEIDRVIVSMTEQQHYATVTIQSVHTSALMLAFGRWTFNRR